jgi:glycosyltransferase involved in cell wall biosynthesis
MRIVIDMQGAQTESRFRGIGRYTLSFVKAIVRNCGEHEVFLALSGLFPDTIEPMRAEFSGLLSQENIRVWYAPGPVKEAESGNETSRLVAELIREAFLISLQPDVIHITSLFEGYVDDAVTSIGRFDTSTPVTVILFDLIPLINSEQYLKPSPRFAGYYHRKVQHLLQAQKFLAISEFTRMEVVNNLNITYDQVINISTAIEPDFNMILVDEDAEFSLRKKLGLTRSFILYAGGADERKNLPRLIQAFSKLPEKLKENYQLVFAGKMPEGNVIHLKQAAEVVGLELGALLFTGYVSDEELASLYKLSNLFVFPSWHEGFGLPALEAMACGAVVIGANTSSLPEVIGLQEALFNPFDINAITSKMMQALTDEPFRVRLSNHGLMQSQQFSWEKTAKRTWESWESLSKIKIFKETDAISLEIKLIDGLKSFLSLSENKQLLSISRSVTQNLISGVERQLLIDVSELSQRDSATGVQRVVRSYLFNMLNNPPSGFKVLPVYATQRETYRYASVFIAKCFNQEANKIIDQPIRWQRGDMFFGLDMQHHVQLLHAETFAQMRNDGVSVKFMVYDLLPIQLADYFEDSNAKELHEQWLKMIALQDEAICISRATAEAYENWLDNNKIPQSKFFNINWTHLGSDLEGSRPSVGMPIKFNKTLEILRSRVTFLAVSTLEPRKAQAQIMDAIELLWADGNDVNIVFVGQQGWKINSFVERISTHSEMGKRLFWLKGISDEYLDLVYKASTCLIAASINEGFGLPLIEAARHGIKIIARDIPVFHEVAGENAYYFSGKEGLQLAQAISDWLKLYREGSAPSSAHFRWFTWHQATENLKVLLFKRNYQRKQLLVDISELVQRDARTGIQRVVRNVLQEWLENPPKGYKVEPVFATETSSYCYARRYVNTFMSEKYNSSIDEPIHFSPGDLFFGLDLQPQVQIANADFFEFMRQQGVAVKFLVHDLIPVQNPEYFPLSADMFFARWLKVVGESDGAICVSKAVADDLKNWMQMQQWHRRRNFEIDVNHNGVDTIFLNEETAIHEKLTGDSKHINKSPIFLMVGTLEPRKGHEQVLEAFENLWRRDININATLVIVGKQGWMVERLIERISNNPKLNKYLFWLNDATDEDLENVYKKSTCLIAASFAEGFGLPLIEAAQYKLPIIARDLPVFREVSNGYAYFFNSLSPNDLADEIESWLLLYERDIHPKSDDMPRITWKQSASELLNKLGLV